MKQVHNWKNLRRFSVFVGIATRAHSCRLLLLLDVAAAAGPVVVAVAVLLD